jgi:hypothetical protein
VAALVVAGVSLFALTGSASAETFTASNTTQLEEAVVKANATTGANTIVLSGGSYLPLTTLRFKNTSGLLTIEGPSSRPTAKLEGSAVEPFPSELFSIAAGASVAFKSVLVSHSGGPGVPAIEDIGSLDLEAVTVAGNKGIGLIVTPGATLSATNSTISDQAAGGMVDNGSASLLNDTVAFNKGVGIENKGSLSLANTIVAENNGGDCVGAASSSDDSLDSNGSCGVGVLSGMNPQLGPLVLDGDGGSTPLHSLKPGSPAIDAGDMAVCPATDQRGFPRPDFPGTPCDIGAEEWNGVAPTIKVPAEITAVQTSPAGAVVKYSAEATPFDSVLRSFSCAPKSGSTFPLGTTTVTCTATDGHENTATATFQVTVLETIHAEFKNWSVTGSLTFPKINATVNLPSGGTFNGSGQFEIAGSRITGAINGAVNIPPFTSEIEFPTKSGEHQVAGLALTEVGSVNATVVSTSSANCPNPVAGTSEMCVNLKVPTTQIETYDVVGPGAGLPSKTVSHCETVEPIKLELSTNLTFLELISVGSHFVGTYTVPPITCSGKYAKGRGEQMTEAFSGQGSYDVNVNPPTM